MNFLFCKKNLEIFLIYKIFCLDRPHFRKSIVRNFDTVFGVIFPLSLKNLVFIESAADTDIC